MRRRAELYPETPAYQKGQDEIRVVIVRTNGRQTKNPTENGLSPYATFSRAEWAHLRDSTPLTLSEADVAALRGINEEISLQEVVDIYLPLSRLLNLYVSATQRLNDATQTFLGNPNLKVPYVIGIAGSVAVGKSTTARILQALLSRWDNHPTVELVTTDGFLYPNEVLEARGLMRRKGFPESYDRRRLLRFVAGIKSGMSPLYAPVYSHITYNIVPDETQTVNRPDIVIIEGLNVLQGAAADQSNPVVSDYFDFSIYVDANERELLRWYVDRFLRLRDTVFRRPDSYFHRYSQLTRDEAVATARAIWDDINGRNLRENILPTRGRAKLVLEKGASHAVLQVRLRKL
jgi:type I pantothenate kinase